MTSNRLCEKRRRRFVAIQDNNKHNELITKNKKRSNKIMDETKMKNEITTINFNFEVPGKLDLDNSDYWNYVKDTFKKMYPERKNLEDYSKFQYNICVIVYVPRPRNFTWWDNHKAEHGYLFPEPDYNIAKILDKTQNELTGIVYPNKAHIFRLACVYQYSAEKYHYVQFIIGSTYGVSTEEANRRRKEYKKRTRK